MNAREDWLQQRRTGVGGSDVAAILGLSKYKTPLQVYQEKRGEIAPQADNDAMRWGRYLEPVVRQAYADETGREVRVLDELVRHPLYEHMIANLDGFVIPEACRVQTDAEDALAGIGALIWPLATGVAALVGWLIYVSVMP